MEMRVIDLLDRFTTCNCIVTVWVYGRKGTLLYKGNFYNVPYHIARCRVTGWDMVNYRATVNIG